MATVELTIPTLVAEGKWQDYRQDIPGDSFNWGPELWANKVNYVVVHHSVTAQTAKTDGNWKAECDKIANLHLARGWAGVGYRFIVCSDGTVAYVGDLSHGGSNVTNNNDHIIGVVLVGDFTKELPTAYQVHSAHLLCDWLLNNMPEYPLLVDWTDMIGHRETYQNPDFPGGTATACPGPAWKVDGDNLYSRIKDDRWQGYPAPEPAVVTQPPTEPPVEPPPVEPPTPPVVDCCADLDQAKIEIASLKGKLFLIDAVIHGKGYTATKYRQIKEIMGS